MRHPPHPSLHYGVIATVTEQREEMPLWYIYWILIPCAEHHPGEKALTAQRPEGFRHTKNRTGQPLEKWKSSGNVVGAAISRPKEYRFPNYKPGHYLVLPEIYIFEKMEAGG